jgi:hypothetical protein
MSFVSRGLGRRGHSLVVLVLCVNHVKFLFIPSYFLIFLLDGTSIPSTPVTVVVVVVARFVTRSMGDTFRGLGDLLVTCHNTRTHTSSKFNAGCVLGFVWPRTPSGKPRRRRRRPVLSVYASLLLYILSSIIFYCLLSVLARRRMAKHGMGLGCSSWCPQIFCGFTDLCRYEAFWVWLKFWTREPLDGCIYTG